MSTQTYSYSHEISLECIRERDRTKTAIKYNLKVFLKRHQEEEEPRGEDESKREQEYCEELLKTTYYVVSFFGE